MSQQSPTMIAEVLIASPLPHLDRTFDYAVPKSAQDDLSVGVRVRVRFGGSDREGFVVGVRSHTDFTGELKPLKSVVSPIPVLPPPLLEQWTAVSDWYAGVRPDVLRLAIPPRHARAEKAALQAAELDQVEAANAIRELWERFPARAMPVVSKAGASEGSHENAISGKPAWDETDHSEWARFVGGTALLRRLAQGQPIHAAWAALPDPWRSIALAAHVSADTGAGVIICVPSESEIVHVTAALMERGTEHTVLHAAAGPHARYRRFIDILLGRHRVVVGTRSAIFAPVSHLGLIICWDDGDPTLREPRAPYPHTREIARIRAQRSQAALLMAGYHRTPQVQDWVESGWMKSISAPRDQVRSHTPRVHALDENDRDREGQAGWARIPTPAFRLIRESSEHGPVLVHVPRRGYLPVVACADCGTTAHCLHCHGPLQIGSSERIPQCTWCGRLQQQWRCPQCDHTTLRGVRIGSGRTAAELGRAFPGVPVLMSSGDDQIHDSVDDHPRIVVATPGAEPEAIGGYCAGLILDSHLTTSHPHLEATSEALRRWLRVGSLIRTTGTLMVAGFADPRTVAALVRWDPIGFAQRELLERVEVGLAPNTRIARVEGDVRGVRALVSGLPQEVEVMGVIDEPDAGGARALVRITRSHSATLTTALQQLLRSRTAKGQEGRVRITMDPISL